jgi:aquaporin related protein
MFLFIGFAAAHTANLPDAASTTSTGTPFTNTANLLYIAFAFGLSLAINIWIFFRVSGGIFNPAVAFALTLAGAISPLRCVLVSVAQIVGGITAAALIHGLLPGPLNVATTLGENTSIVQGAISCPVEQS